MQNTEQWKLSLWTTNSKGSCMIESVEFTTKNSRTIEEITKKIDILWKNWADRETWLWWIYYKRVRSTFRKINYYYFIVLQRRREEVPTQLICLVINWLLVYNQWNWSPRIHPGRDRQFSPNAAWMGNFDYLVLISIVQIKYSHSTVLTVMDWNSHERRGTSRSWSHSICKLSSSKPSGDRKKVVRHTYRYFNFNISNVTCNSVREV